MYCHTHLVYSYSVHILAIIRTSTIYGIDYTEFGSYRQLTFLLQVRYSTRAENSFRFTTVPDIPSAGSGV